MLSQTSKYALRALVELARHQNGEAMRGHELAECTNIPAKYLSKVMLILRNAGLIEATRGSGGGYRLIKSADSIALIDVMVLFEGKSARPECFLGVNKECDPRHPCSAHASWGSLRAMFLGFLEHTMVSEISRSPNPSLALDEIADIGGRP